MGKPDMKGAVNYILDRLRNELPKELYYHSVSHTEEYVLPAAMLFARHEGIKGEDLLLLATAAAYHDSGFLVRYNDNEQIGAGIARETLPYFHYSILQIDRVAELIMATRMAEKRQQPDKSDLSQLVLCDADMDTLGRKEFFLVGELLRLECSIYDRNREPREWMEEQLAFQEEHSYLTRSAKAMRDQRKDENIRQLRDLLQQNKKI
jgi:HD superfamily phosphodiesterase